jgi:uncharacterized membrane protein YgcG
MEEEAELLLLALQDFKHALASGCSEAAATLQSYLVELRGAPHELLHQLATAWREHAGAGALTAAAASPAAWQQLLNLQALLLRVVGPCGGAVQLVQGVLEDAAVGMLYGQAGEAAEAAVERLEACQGQVAALLRGGRLQRLPAPATHQQRRSMLACLLYLQLSQHTAAAAGAACTAGAASGGGGSGGVPPEVLQQLAALAAPAWLGRDLLHAQQQMAAAFEAFAAVMQCRSMRQRLQASTHEPAGDAEAEAEAVGGGGHAAALCFLQLFRAPLPAVTDMWWGHYTALLYGLVQQAEHSGVLALRRPASQALVRSLCSTETAHMVVQLVLAHPAYQQPDGSSGADSRAGAGGGSRKRGAGGGGSKGGASTAAGAGAGAGAKRALATAAALLAHDVPAFLGGCCELLRPEANCPLQTRVEALAGGRACHELPTVPACRCRLSAHFFPF